MRRCWGLLGLPPEEESKLIGRIALGSKSLLQIIKSAIQLFGDKATHLCSRLLPHPNISNRHLHVQQAPVLAPDSSERGTGKIVAYLSSFLHLILDFALLQLLYLGKPLTTPSCMS